jgi:alpha-beta hydrolase superfamily lysophospholipase
MGKPYPSECSALPDFTVDQETVDDAVAAVKLLRETRKVDPGKVFVLGHSMGAMLAPRIAARCAAELGRAPGGVVLMAGNATNMLDLTVEQVQYIASLDGKVDDAEAKQVQELKDQVARIKEGKLRPGEVVLGAPQAYCGRPRQVRPGRVR